MRRLAAAGHRRMPWKNGGGETIEIAVFPEGADLSGFAWRISMARVAADGPFSVFPGVDRTLCILDGAALDLAIAGLERHRLTADSDPLAFPADAAAEARLPDGPITDLNVMTRRGLYRHSVRRVDAGDGRPLPVTGRWAFVIPSGACRIADAQEALDVAAGDVVLVEAPTLSVTVEAEHPLRIHVVEIRAAT